ncbi:hypothetical protein IPGJFKPH_00164 [Klebsiella phage vB_KoM-Pickle]|jgi:hypothetical protein|uniref:Uncharacterized protein n=3 Tax=Viruses TaxID=10239 RepID=A0A1G4GQD3_9CAUD|nr:hypothetical protein FDI05_gp165 [Enterobacter phage phiEap-3]YP_009626401.1 hypothetical protein FDG72_gp191 [Klebsiella phage PMBT1]UJP30854.1 hypothetical protein phKl35c1_227 [Klebsiella phage Kpn35c1]UUG66938.1 hypothetical protein 2DI_00056 [Klebsiella phage PSKm2DI]UZO33317.1 hypothetical protein KEKKGBKC_00047 [Klebsiella phage pR7_1]WKN59676.1 hypothetical protein ayl_00093 [Klebsiella phage AYL]WMX18075.1 hypothetical protein [Klebsiella phage KpF2]WNA09043.1 hypothetical protei
MRDQPFSKKYRLWAEHVRSLLSPLNISYNDHHCTFFGFFSDGMTPEEAIKFFMEYK